MFFFLHPAYRINFVFTLTCTKHCIPQHLHCYRADVERSNLFQKMYYSNSWVFKLLHKCLHMKSDEETVHMTKLLSCYVLINVLFFFQHAHFQHVREWPLLLPSIRSGTRDDVQNRNGMLQWYDFSVLTWTFFFILTPYHPKKYIEKKKLINNSLFYI